MSTALPPADHLRPLPLNIEEELKESYLNYAMSVIISRALPDVRDGLKPSQRRILMAMLDLGLSPGGSTSKCAGIVGETMKRYHPHGDNSIYPTLARMAQWWNMRHLLISGQGNFGSIHGLPPAAMRYTEAKLSPVAAEMLEDIKLDTVDFQPSYDEKHQEPRVLPGKFPNLLVNGSGGIAVGMATSIPPHNLGEVCDAVVAWIDNPQIELDELLEIIPAPDFPTGATICGRHTVREAYRTGRGKVILRAKYTIEEQKDGRSQIIFTEIPYQLTKEPLLKKLAELVNTDRVTGVTDIQDESGRKEPVRIVVKVKKGEDPNVVLNQLFQYSPLQDSFSVIMLALVDGRPRTLPLKEFLRLFVEHRVNVIRRRTQFQLRQARARAHILEGLLVALSYIDEIIRVIRSSANPVEARARLMGLEVSAEILRRALDDPDAKAATSLTRMQADAILAMRLQQLTGLEADKLGGEYKGLKRDIAEYERILGDEQVILDLIRADMRELKSKYANPRRSVIDLEELGDYDKEALIREEYMVVTVTHDGYIKRLPPSTYRAQNRGGRGITAANTKEGDFLERMFVALTHDYILFFTDRGKVYWLKVYDLPMAARTSGGRAIVNLLQLAEGEKITGLIPVRKFNEDECLMMVTRRGTVKKTELTAFSRPLGRGIIALGLDEGDQLIGVARTKAGDQVVLSTSQGMAIRFDESDVRAMGRPAHGVRGIGLLDDDEVIGMIVANGEDDPASILTVCAKGFGKRTILTEYRSQRRGGKGLIDIKTTDRNGPVVAIAKVTEADEVMLTTTSGILIRTPVADMREIGRNTQGVRLIRVEEGDSVSSLAKLPEEELTADVEAEVEAAGLHADAIPVDGETAHIMDDGVAEAEARDHIDEVDAGSEPEA
ncbi:DNA gyrase subunit A [Singulisphaera acidiphila]|uniref:DNA gyrase subunit A n=1 Tax=Singulisphaera acidiphila (strain ATCC BAA-1392 / DSM 18658 / VKM B-2454 / MOB10) TaxID=886293 RepID=L0D7I2_SINAD|nr:DNA gyrase subunit A [Singulisphaera acidiphila]AGA24596.1 DNA gyrase, A subunit [Singulisphaera acidiphila DSM 18658]